MENTDPKNRKHVATVVPNGVDKVRLACQDGEILIAVNRVNRLDFEAPDLERNPGIRDGDSVLRNTELSDTVQAWTRQNKRGAAACGEAFEGWNLNYAQNSPRRRRVRMI